jgi:cell division septal protein FtsQ
MNHYSWSNLRKRGKSAGVKPSRREQARNKSQRRARAHLDRIRNPIAFEPPRSLILGAVVVVALVVGLCLGNPLIAAARSWMAGEPVTLTTIAVRGAQRLSGAAIAEFTGVSHGAELHLIDVAEIEEKLSEHPWIVQARAVRLPTGQLLIDVSERIARAVVTTERGKAGLAVNTAGIPFAPVEGQDLAELPRLITDESFQTEVVDERLARAIALADRLRDFDLPLPESISIAAESDPVGFSVRLQNFSPEIIFGRKDFETRLTKLARVFEENLEEFRLALSVDLRFADQTVLRGTSSSKEAAQAAAARGRAASSKARPTG